MLNQLEDRDVFAFGRSFSTENSFPLNSPDHLPNENKEIL